MNSFFFFIARWTWTHAALLLLFGTAQAAQPADPPADDRGFSYFMGLGRHTVTYQETAGILPVQSRAKVSSPLLMTGALYAVNADNLLSLDSETTFAPGTVTEQWHARASTVGGIPITDPLLQTNRFSLHQTTSRLLLLHRLKRQLFGVGGLSFHSHSFKRFGFVAGADDAVNLPAGALEEAVSEALLNLGVGLESERVRNSRDHYSLRLAVARPVWRRVQNTGFPNHSFNGTAGYDVSVAGRYSYAVLPNIHVGAWGQYLHGERGAQSRDGTVELPRSRLGSLSYGVELLWKL